MLDLALAGLCIRWSPLADQDTLALGGPAVYAAIGSRLSHCVPCMSLRLGTDISVRESAFIQRIGAPTSHIEHIQLSNLMLQSAEQGNGSAGISIRGEPSTLSPVYVPLNAGLLAIGNLDPSAMLSTVDAWHGIVAVDCYGPWIRFRPKSCCALASQADLLSLTQDELAVFPPQFQSELLEAKGRYVMLKKGPAGVDLLHNGAVYSLPPPSPTLVRSDLGAGDFLLGLMTGHMAKRLSPGQGLCSDLVIEAYMASRPWLATLLETPLPTDFLGRQEFVG